MYLLRAATSRSANVSVLITGNKSLCTPQSCTRVPDCQLSHGPNSTLSGRERHDKLVCEIGNWGSYISKRLNSLMSKVVGTAVSLTVLVGGSYIEGKVPGHNADSSWLYNRNGSNNSRQVKHNSSHVTSKRRQP
jgi:hypothetical protein